MRAGLVRPGATRVSMRVCAAPRVSPWIRRRGLSRRRSRVRVPSLPSKRPANNHTVLPSKTSAPHTRHTDETRRGPKRPRTGPEPWAGSQVQAGCALTGNAAGVGANVAGGSQTQHSGCRGRGAQLHSEADPHIIERFSSSSRGVSADACRSRRRRSQTAAPPTTMTTQQVGHPTAQRATNRGAGPPGETCATACGYSPLPCASG